MIKKYESSLSYWVSEKDRGQSHAINKGFDVSTGELLCWLNSDDILYPDALNSVAKTFCNLNGSTYGAIVGNGDIVNASGHITFSPSVPELSTEALLNWGFGTNFMQPSCFFTRMAWDRAGPLDESLDYCMDLDLWLRISRDFNFHRLDKMLSQSLAHPDAKTTRDFIKAQMETALLIDRYGGKKQALKCLYAYADELNVARQKLERFEYGQVYKVATVIDSFIRKLLRR